MDSASRQSDVPPEQPHSRLFNLLGAVVALATLLLPIVTISHFSPTVRINSLNSAPYSPLVQD